MYPTTDAFLALIRPHRHRLHLAARQYARSDADARDLVQETLLRAWRGYLPAEDRTYRRAWLFVILRNVAAEWHRAAQRRIRLVPVSDAELTDRPTQPVDGSLAPLPNMDEARFREFLDDNVAAALDALDPAFREVVVLSVAGGLTYREIAEIVDCPIGTVMSRMARARRQLRSRLAALAPRTRRNETRRNKEVQS